MHNKIKTLPDCTCPRRTLTVYVGVKVGALKTKASADLARCQAIYGRLFRTFGMRRKYSPTKFWTVLRIRRVLNMQLCSQHTWTVGKRTRCINRCQKMRPAWRGLFALFKTVFDDLLTTQIRMMTKWFLTELIVAGEANSKCYVKCLPTYNTSISSRYCKDYKRKNRVCLNEDTSPACQSQCWTTQDINNHEKNLNGVGDLTEYDLSEKSLLIDAYYADERHRSSGNETTLAEQLLRFESNHNNRIFYTKYWHLLWSQFTLEYEVSCHLRQLEI
jgi:hypothetical protein